MSPPPVWPLAVRMTSIREVVGAGRVPNGASEVTAFFWDGLGEHMRLLQPGAGRHWGGLRGVGQREVVVAGVCAKSIDGGIKVEGRVCSTVGA